MFALPSSYRQLERSQYRVMVGCRIGCGVANHLISPGVLRQRLGGQQVIAAHGGELDIPVGYGGHGRHLERVQLKTQVYPASGFQMCQYAAVDSLQVASEVARTMVGCQGRPVLGFRVVGRGRVEVAGDQGQLVWCRLWWLALALSTQ